MLLAAINGTVAFLLLIVGLGIIIFVHELGHFLVAKAVGIRCTQFALGFGHALLAWRKGIGLCLGSTEPQVARRVGDHLKKQGIDAEPSSADYFRAMAELGLGETEYRVNWMPLGGYVKMLGQEDLNPAKVSSDPRSYNMKPVWARLCVISAGVVMNLVFGALFFIIAFMIGVAFPPAQVGQVLPGSPAATTAALEQPDIVGLQPGDEILAIDGKKPSDFTSLKVAVGLSGPGKEIRLRVRRPSPDGQSSTTLTFPVRPRRNSPGDLPTIGILPPAATALIQPDNPRDLAQLAEALKPLGLRPGWKLTAVNGQLVQHHWQYVHAVARYDGRPLQATFTAPDGQATTVPLKPQPQLQSIERPVAGSRTDKREILLHLAGLVPAMKIAAVEPDSPAHGILQPDDIVAAVGSTAWPSLGQFSQAIQQAAGKPVNITVIRKGKRRELTVTPRRKYLGGMAGPGRIGVAMSYDLEHCFIATVLPDTPFHDLAEKLLPGTLITAVNGTAVTDFHDLCLALKHAGDQPVRLDVVLPVGGGTGQRLELALDHQARQAIQNLAWLDPIGAYFDSLKVTQKASSPLAAVSMGIDKTVLFLRQTYLTLAQLLRRQLALKNMVGPIGIVNVGQRFATEGLGYLLFFMGLLSVNLAVINFLPIPVTDGGHFILLTIEKMRGKPLSLKVQQAATTIGLLLLLAVFLTVTYYDILRTWFSG